MGGLSFVHEATGVEMGYQSFNIKNSWFDAHQSMDGAQSLWSAAQKCSRDADGECSKSGCLSDDGWAGHLMDRDDLLDANRKLLAFLKANPKWTGRLNDTSEWNAAYATTAGLVETLKTYDSDDNIIMFDRSQSLDLSPCPRYLPRYEEGCMYLFGHRLPHRVAHQFKQSGHWKQWVDKEYSKVTVPSEVWGG